ncbi:MAG: sterile alpha motif-like domain-containing protein [Candidatus Thiodiazotropha sp. (ex Monitilora ramsayi)]|nr:sterile alpha motif-like domain-containing protein [Candidatus Thiodiazotropha sp. (ex Monitilora ramsayi)]
MIKSGFYNWLLSQENRDDPIGDLANDVEKDKNAPVDSDSLDTWYTYLSMNGACTGALEALEAAWNEYGDIE